MAAVFVLPTTTSGQIGPVAAYMSTGGWAAAADRVLGGSWIVCPTGLITTEEALRWGTRSGRGGEGGGRGDARPGGAGGQGGTGAGGQGGTGGGGGGRATGPAAPVGSTGRAGAMWDRARGAGWTGAIRARTPRVVKTLAKDGIEVARSRRFHIDPDGPWTGSDVDFVWQRHSLFHTAGLDLADALRRPSVLFAPATTVWEAERWGTRRPGWGPLAERYGERPALTRADVVACGSVEVAAQAERIGADPERIVVTPSGVELDLFGQAGARRDERRRSLGIEGRFVVGWVGSFRPFHSLERAVHAVAGIPDATLLLVGDGPERPAIEALAEERGVDARFTGTVGHRSLASMLGAMDVGLVLAPRDGRFHYSPLKLGEYLASGLAVVAPDVAPITRRLTDGEDALLFSPDDSVGLHDAIKRLHDDPTLRQAIAERGRDTAELRWSWDEQVRSVLGVLDRAARRS